MAIKYTEEQQRVIDLRRCNILVAAAAGSGKTAVLVERIIARLTKDQPPLDVDQLLIVTFTEAAAAEMKERIHGAIEKALELQPGNEHLQRQATLIHQAKITTMHKFCLSVIREHFHTIGLDPGFRVAEEGEIKLLKRDVLEQVLEDAYAGGTEEFLSFVESFASGKDDSGLENIILQLQEYAESYPNPNRWLDACVEQYEVSTLEELEEKAYVKDLVKELRTILEDLMREAHVALEICRSEDGPKGYEKAILCDLKLLESWLKNETYAQMHQSFGSVAWESLGRNSKDVSEDKMNQVKKIRQGIKDVVADFSRHFFFDSISEMQKDMEVAKRHVSVLASLVKKFNQAFADEKRRKNVIDFGDMEHFALQILTKDDGDVLVPSEVALGYQHSFSEVMMDEYQDTNYLQEAILTSVSRVSKGQHNIFMVGDVKQSIYSFRLSRPELFMEKFHTYTDGYGNRQRIDLHKNFRSREEVLHSTNYVFEQIMTTSFGGIAYDENAALYVGADYQPHAGNETELLLVDLPSIKARERMELEAELIAMRIQELLRSHEVYDKHSEGYRKVRYSDIVILSRSPKSWNEVLSKVLENAGIPCYTGSTEGYFQTQEIRIILNYLKVLDNPRQDIALTSVLASMFVGLGTEELARLRSETTERSIYECVVEYLAIGTDNQIKAKIGRFLQMLDEFRKRVPYTAIHTLLWQIIHESGYGMYVSALPGGEQRSANLSMLIEKAVSFETTSYKGLFNFIRYIEQLEKYEIDYGEADILDENMDVVRLMSIHKSKGLEFPIVFVAGLGKQFNTEDTKKSVLMHAEWGMGVDSINETWRTKAPTLLKEAIRQKTMRDMMAEELRVLYVAMTRAKEKLILTAGVSDLEKRMQYLGTLQYRNQTPLPYLNLTKAKGYLDWLLFAVCRNQCFSHVMEDYQIPINFQQKLYQRSLPMIVRRYTLDDLMVWNAGTVVAEQLTEDVLVNWNTTVVYDSDIKEQIGQQFGYQYPYEHEQTIKQKRTVSELKKQAFTEPDGEEMFKEEPVVPMLPKFLTESHELQGASRGSAYHKFLELLDFSKTYDMDTLQSILFEMKHKGMLSEEMASSIRLKDVLGFLESNIGKRVQNASTRGVCYAEQPFVIGVPVREIDATSASEEIILVQGIIDLYFEEADGFVVLDYKTDRVLAPKELQERYGLQLDYYAKALEQVTGKKVKEKVIYSFALAKEISCESENE